MKMAVMELNSVVPQFNADARNIPRGMGEGDGLHPL